MLIYFLETKESVYNFNRESYPVSISFFLIKTKTKIIIKKNERPSKPDNYQ